MGPSDKSRGVAFLLAVVLGVFGAHRFYVGKIGTGILMICTVGGAGVWYLYDVVQIAAGNFTDVRGRRVRRWSFEERDEPPPTLSDELIEEVEALRREVAELAERVDFAERLLQRPDARRPGQEPSA